MKISLAFSTCPNDTFIFDAWVNSRIDSDGFEPEVWMGDILHLNEKAIAREFDVIKVSYATYGKVKDHYTLLRSGGALGKGCGPLLIAAKPITVEQLVEQQAKIAIPGFNTTANKLLSFFEPCLINRKEMLFHEVMNAVKNGEADAGVIIHENRFTYQDEGLFCVQDLGTFWEEKTNLPVPLGAIIAKKSLGEENIHRIESLIRKSVQYAFDHPEASADYVKQNAQEMNLEICQAHIDLYVNEYSLDIGEEGLKAVEALLNC